MSYNFNRPTNVPSVPAKQTGTCKNHNFSSVPCYSILAGSTVVFREIDDLFIKLSTVQTY